MFMDRELSVEMSVSLLIMVGIQVHSVKLTAVHFVDIKNISLKLMRGDQWSRISKRILKNKPMLGDFPDSEMYYVITVLVKEQTSR